MVGGSHGPLAPTYDHTSVAVPTFASRRMSMKSIYLLFLPAKTSSPFLCEQRNSPKTLLATETPLSHLLLLKGHPPPLDNVHGELVDCLTGSPVMPVIWL